MSRLINSWRSLGFWFGPVLLLGSLLLGFVVMLVAGNVFPPAIFLLLVPVGGLLLGVLLILRGTQPGWAKLLALSPVLGPLLLIVAGSLLPSRTDHVIAKNYFVFLIPAGFRGRVTLIQDQLAETPPKDVEGRIMLHVPQNGQIKMSEVFDTTDFVNAYYYAASPRGQRLHLLPILQESAFEQHARYGRPREQPDPQQVGVFIGPTLAVQQTRSPRAYANEIRHKANTESGLLTTFIVACYDSLKIQRQ